jgi:hypothetical protein
MSHAMPPGPPPGHYPPQWQPQTATPPPPKKKRRWPWIAAAAVVLVLFFAILADAAGGDPDPATTGPASPPETQTWVVKPTPAPAPAPAGPKTTFDDGTYKVGTGAGQVAPGSYTSPGSEFCYWARLKRNDGELGDIISNNAGKGQQILNVKATDGYVTVSGGCTFTKQG